MLFQNKWIVTLLLQFTLERRSGSTIINFTYKAMFRDNAFGLCSTHIQKTVNISFKPQIWLIKCQIQFSSCHFFICSPYEIAMWMVLQLREVVNVSPWYEKYVKRSHCVVHMICKVYTYAICKYGPYGVMYMLSPYWRLAVTSYCRVNVVFSTFLKYLYCTSFVTPHS